VSPSRRAHTTHGCVRRASFGLPGRCDRGRYARSGACTPRTRPCSGAAQGWTPCRGAFAEPRRDGGCLRRARGCARVTRSSYPHFEHPWDRLEPLVGVGGVTPAARGLADDCARFQGLAHGSIGSCPHTAGRARSRAGPSLPRDVENDVTFSSEAWQSIRTVRGAIDRLPFLSALADGSLSTEVFNYYLTQDAHYLASYGRVLAGAAAQTGQPDELVFWAQSAVNTVTVERQLHAAHVFDFSVVQPSPTCTAYTSYLFSLTSGGSYPALIARPDPRLPRGGRARTPWHPVEGDGRRRLRPVRQVTHAPRSPRPGLHRLGAPCLMHPHGSARPALPSCPRGPRPRCCLDSSRLRLPYLREFQSDLIGRPSGRT